MTMQPHFFPVATPHTTINLSDIIQRLTAIMQEENQILLDQREQSLEPVIHRKSQILLELMRAEKSIPQEEASQAYHQDMASLKQVMERNQYLLSIHLSASHAITDTLLNAMRLSDSDGTYGRFA